MEIMEAVDRIRENREIIKPTYEGEISFDVAFIDEGDSWELCLYIPTNWKQFLREDTENVNEKKQDIENRIKEIFHAEKVEFIDIRIEGKGPEPFWSVVLERD